MIYEMFAIYDSAIGAFNAPIFVRSRGEAIRSFQDACNDQKTEFYRHASDYTLFHLGVYNDSDANFTPLHAPERVVSALEVIVKNS